MIDLYLSLFERKRPEDIANLILSKYGDKYSNKDRKIIELAAKRALERNRFGYSSMSDEFYKPVGMKKQIEVAKELFPNNILLDEEDYSNPLEIKEYIINIENEINKGFGKNDFLRDRINKKLRKENGIEISKRQYNKRFRLLKRLEEKRDKLVRELKKGEFTRIGKSSLAIKLNYEDFSNDIYTACFISYFVSRCNLRSEFTIYGQQRAYDEIAHTLFSKCQISETTNWWAIAHVFPEQEVLKKLSDEQKGKLIGIWYSILQEIALFLEELWMNSDINRECMIVKKGNDSSTWNNTANAWNKARDNWISLNYSFGTEEIVENICFGKVLRLMAADVAYWHQISGGDLDVDTMVWNDLPLPWEVFSGAKSCSKKDVLIVCNKYGINAGEKGWVSPKPPKKKNKYIPTPELVHGVSVAHPGLALLLKKAGYFSGKK